MEPVSSPGRPKNRRLRPAAIGRLVRRFSPHLRPYRRTLVGAAICMVGVAAAEIVRPWPLKIIFDGILSPQAEPAGVLAWSLNLANDQTVLLAGAAGAILAAACFRLGNPT